MGELMLHAGRLRSARRYLDRCQRLIAGAGRPVPSTQASAAAATCYAAWLYWHLDDGARALGYAEQALDRARSLQQPFALAIALCLVAGLYRFRDEPEPALALAREGVALSTEQAFPFWRGSTLTTLGWAVARGGDPANGIETIRHGIDVFRATGARVQLPSWLGSLADAYRVAGRVDDAERTIEQALDWAERTGDRCFVPQLKKLRGRLRRGANTAVSEKT